MTEQDYLTSRVDDQMAWLEKKAAFNQKRYKRVRTLILIISVSIPLAAGFIEEGRDWLKVAVGVGGAAVAIFQGILNLQNYQELWTQYRVTAETLKREKFLFQTKAGKYLQAANPFHEFVVNIEAILAGENQAWLQEISKKDNEEDED